MDNSPALPPAADQLYWSRPSQAHLRVLNLAALTLASHKEAALAVLSNSFYAVETIKRSPHPIALVGTGVFDPFLFADHLGYWAWGEVQPLSWDDLAGPYSAMLWAEPLTSNGDQVARRLTAAARRGCAMEVITSSWRGWGAASASARKAGQESLNPGTVMRMLRRTGWDVDAVVPFSGLRAFFWQKLGDFFHRLDWLAWSDRCHLTLNNQMREPAWQWRLASLVLIRARKG